MLECRKLALYLATDTLSRNSNLATGERATNWPIVASYGAGTDFDLHSE